MSGFYARQVRKTEIKEKIIELLKSPSPDELIQFVLSVYDNGYDEGKKDGKEEGIIEGRDNYKHYKRLCNH